MSHDEILEALILQFRRGLVLRRTGKTEEAQQILEITVPGEVRRWSQANTALSSDEKKAILRDTFRRELGRVEDAFLIYELLAERIEQDIIPALCEQVTLQLRNLLSQGSGALSPQQTKPNVDPLVEKLGKMPPRAPKRVSFDDLPGMIDMLLEREYDQRQNPR